MIFRFVVAHCRSLARVPLLPQLFEAMLLCWTLLTNRRKLRAIELLEREATRSFGAEACTHRFGGTEFRVAGRELGHVHGNGLFDAPVGKTQRAALVSSGAALPHHVFADSGWVSFWIDCEADVQTALALMRIVARPRGFATTHASQGRRGIEQ